MSYTKLFACKIREGSIIDTVILVTFRIPFIIIAIYVVITRVIRSGHIPDNRPCLPQHLFPAYCHICGGVCVPFLLAYRNSAQPLLPAALQQRREVAIIRDQHKDVLHAVAPPKGPQLLQQAVGIELQRVISGLRALADLDQPYAQQRQRELQVIAGCRMEYFCLCLQETLVEGVVVEVLFAAAGVQQLLLPLPLVQLN